MGATLKAMKNKILVIDDDPGILESLKDMLALENIECLLATNATQGLSLAGSGNPELIVTDVQLPDMSGFQVCQSLKRDPSFKKIPVVMMTARFTEPQDRVQGLELGADDFFVKPFNAVYFVARLQSLLRSTVLPGPEVQTA